MRLILHFIFLSIFESLFASSIESFNPFIITYSKVILLPVGKGYSFKTLSNSSIGYFLFTGMILSLVLLSDALREIARFILRFSFASFLISGISPDVESVILLAGSFKP